MSSVTRKIKYQSVEVDTSNLLTGFTLPTLTSPAHGKMSFESDRQYEKVKGIAIQLIPLSPGVDTSVVKIKKFEIQNREIYPDGLYVAYMNTSSDVDFNKKFDLEVDEEAKGTKVDIEFEDAKYTIGVDYKFVVTLKLVNP